MYFSMGLSAGWYINFSGQMRTDLRDGIFNISDQTDFKEKTLKIFDYQRTHNNLYQEFINSLGKVNETVEELSEIPFLPVEFFRNHKIITGDLPVEVIFESSGTTGVNPGRHFVNDLSLYEESFLKTFNLFYGDPTEYLIAALLPSYTERSGSSLVYMADKLIKLSGNPLSGFYKDNFNDLLVSN